MSMLGKFFEEFTNPATFSGAIFYALVFLAIAWFTARSLRLALRRLVEKDKRGLVDHTSLSFVVQLLQVSIYLIAFILYAHLIPALRHLGTALLASVGVITVVLGMAAQQTLNNLIAGVSLVLYRPLHVGDFLQIAAPTGVETGVVESLTLGYTILRTLDNRRIVVPNSVMASQVTINLSFKDPRIMLNVPVTVQWKDVEMARRILLELAQAHPQVQEVVGCPITQLGNTGVTLTLQVWCADATIAQQVMYELYERILEKFVENGIRYT